MEDDTREELGRQETSEGRMDRQIGQEQQREEYNEDTQTLDFRKLRVTDMRDNPRVVLPDLRLPNEELVLEAKGLLCNEAVDDYQRKHCKNGC